MYIVVSKWKVEAGHEDAFRNAGGKARAEMRKQPGVEMVEAFKGEDGNAVAIVAYADEAAYKRVMAEGGPFETIAKKFDIESQGTWQWSERGEAIDHEPALA